jgi:hypothetical protein
MPINADIEKPQVLSPSSGDNKAVKILVDASCPADSTTSTESLSCGSKDGVSRVTAGPRIKLDAALISAAAQQASIAAAKSYASREEERIQQRNSLGSMPPPPPPLFSHRSFPSPSGSTQTNNPSRSHSNSQAGVSGSSVIPPTWNIKALTPEAIAAAANDAVKKMMGSHPQLQVKEPKPSTSTGSIPRLSNSGLLIGSRDKIKELDPNKPDEGWLAANLCYSKFSNDKIPLTLSSEIIADLDQDLAALQIDTALSQQPLPPLVSASPKKRLRDNGAS